ncbi:protein of unknown function [Candidatus Promineifilum breve]|uniref:Uncharacterized protein n=1 Tax=Candidatus Promineifilum breve TaxID=1806508 RepID=A0A160T5I6_9CHLR|nr:protein of unknown function [Candidatus Promineifilum breve]
MHLCKQVPPVQRTSEGASHWGHLNAWLQLVSLSLRRGNGTLNYPAYLLRSEPDVTQTLDRSPAHRPTVLHRRPG